MQKYEVMLMIIDIIISKWMNARGCIGDEIIYKKIEQYRRDNRPLRFTNVDCMGVELPMIEILV